MKEHIKKLKTKTNKNKKLGVAGETGKLTAKIVVGFILIVGIVSACAFWFLRVPEITTILQNQPVSEWIPSLFKVGIKPALILAIIFIAVKIVLYCAKWVFWLFVGVFVWKIIVSIINIFLENAEKKLSDKQENANKANVDNDEENMINNAEREEAEY